MNLRPEYEYKKGVNRLLFRLKRKATTCTGAYGIEPSVTQFGVPLGTVFDKPVSSMLNMLYVMFFAGSFHIALTPGRLVLAVLISSIVAVASPPIAGGGAVAISVLFAQMGIPKKRWLSLWQSICWLIFR